MAYGYFLVIAAIAAICGSLYWRFHRNGWDCALLRVLLSAAIA